jgi:predicted ArsR family transcriptional regulator
MKPEKNPEKILMYLKMNGSQSAAELAKVFRMTGEGMRLHLLKLEEGGLICSESVSKGVGRPTILYKLTKKGEEHFPNNHAALTVQLLESVQNIFGQEALQLLVDEKREKDFIKYENALSGLQTTEEKIDRLAEIRNNEGYMAEWEKDDEGYIFIENHCPICAAASQCGGFCKSEFENIKKLIGQFDIERIDHTIKGDRRCAYRINIKK